MANANEYIVFEADQVLTNEHLNETFNYLDQQNRWTRNKLIGIGIVCGFNIVQHSGVIEITKGCGVTSQGYLILKDAGHYAYMLPYVAPEEPEDLPFKYGDTLPFYRPFCDKKEIYLLLTDSEYDDLEENKKPQAKTLSSQKGGFLNDFVVVLFLEATEMDLKNCSAFDCTNKGGKMQFNVRPLLVKKDDLPGKAKAIEKGFEKERQRFAEFEIERERARLSHEITFKRFNVPYTPLKSSTDVIKAFAKIVDDYTLQQVANAYIYCYEKHAALLPEKVNPFIGLFKKLKEYRDTILEEAPIFIQYFYDFIDDLILAYYEFCVKITGIVSQRCPDENLFPLHLVLGDASKNTEPFKHDAWRTYFIYSPLFTKNNWEGNEAKFFFRRMIIMVKEFTILAGTAGRKTSTIKITPSQYGYLWLSQRAIPYYYHIATGENAIYNYWDFYKSSHGNAVFNLSYNANLYNHAKAALHPLLYDIEHYNFFRIEGHIGQNYTSVLSNILEQRLEYNLPFDVVAISADLLRSNAKLPVCNMQDLETDYKLIISEFACKVHTPFCFLTKFPYPPDTEVFAGGMKEVAGMEGFSSYRTKAAKHFSNLQGMQGAMLNSNYKLGDFMRKYCMPDDEKTIGGYYLRSLDIASAEEDSGFGNIHHTAEQNALSLIYNSIFSFINAVEELMMLLNTSTVATIDMELLQKKYSVYTASLARLTFILAELVSSAKLKLSAAIKLLELHMLVDEFFILTTVCIDERLQTLVDEYKRRLYVFQLQNTFLNYYKKHPGLEHKAGVPKGGTFVLVYYSEREEQATEFVRGTEFAAGQRMENTGAAMSNDRVEVKAKMAGAYEEMLGYEKKPQIEIDNVDEKMILGFINKCKDASDDDKQKIIDLFRPKEVNQRFRFRPDEVIADFYVPYLCCSDCPPIAYILPDKKEPVPPVINKPTIKMGTTFCEDDDKPSPVTVSPAGGKVTDDKGNEAPGIEKDGDGFVFIPRKAGRGEYTFVYTQGGTESEPVKVTVLPAPKTSAFKFTSEFDKDRQFKVTFTPEIPDDKFTYAWTFGDGFSESSSTEREPALLAAISNSGAEKPTFASLQVSNGDCPAALVTRELMISPNGVYEPKSFSDEMIDIKDMPVNKKTGNKPEAPAAPEASAPNEKP